jgi:hypothetical protein
MNWYKIHKYQDLHGLVKSNVYGLHVNFIDIYCRLKKGDILLKKLEICCIR